jgi:hypothetical protein
VCWASCTSLPAAGTPLSSAVLVVLAVVGWLVGCVARCDARQPPCALECRDLRVSKAPLRMFVVDGCHAHWLVIQGDLGQEAYGFLQQVWCAVYSSTAGVLCFTWGCLLFYSRLFLCDHHWLVATSFSQ